MRRAAGAAGGGLALILAALLFDAAPLFVAGIAFTALGVLMPVWIWTAAAGATIERQLSCDRVIEEEPFEATIEVTRGPWGLPGGEVLDPLAGRPVSLSAPLSLLGGSRSASVRVVARFARRGIRHLEPSSLVIKDPLELARAVRVGGGGAQELLVLPRTERVRWMGAGAGARLQQSAAAAAAEPLAAADLDGLRPYRPGAPASRIHWPALARGAGLLERRLRADTDTRPLVVLDARSSGPAEHLDAAVRAAASLVLELARRGGCGLLLPGERRPIEIERDLAGWPAAHARLAVVEGGPKTRAPALAQAGRLGPIFYVAAAPLRRVPTVPGAGGRAEVLVIPASLSARMPQAASFEVAGCRGFSAGAGRRPAARERAA